MNQTSTPDANTPPPRRFRKAVRILAIVLLSLVLLVAAALVYARHRLLASLPITSGTLTVPGLTAPVTIHRDARSVPTIQAENYLDALTALGFLHAQDRFFQMDLTRRYARGELSGLLGKQTIQRDQRIRRMQLHDAARSALQNLHPAQTERIERYTQGVNAGLRALEAHPPEYLLLGVEPQPWETLDCIYVQLALMLSLSENASRDLERNAIENALAPNVVSVISPRRTSLDSPILPGEPTTHHSIPLDDPDDERFSAIDIAQQPQRTRAELWAAIGRRAPLSEDSEARADQPLSEPDPEPAGSNAWAVSGAHTHAPAALLAGDMHLRHTLPGTWYHAQLEWGAGGWSETRTPTRLLQTPHQGVPTDGQYVGLTTPGGMPMLAGGSTANIAFAFTNLHADLTDLVLVQPADDELNQYQTPEGVEDFVRTEAVIEVRGHEPTVINLLDTRWGPIIGQDGFGRLYALKWIGRETQALLVSTHELLGARDAQDAVSRTRGEGGPPMNLIIADAEGGIAWTMTGLIPDRRGYTGRTPIDGTNPDWSWRGVREPTSIAPIVNPTTGAVFSANHRTTDAPSWHELGDPFGEPARAHRIADRLRALIEPDASSSLPAPIDEADFLQLQLDTHAHRYEYLRRGVPDLLRASADQDVARLGTRFAEWDGTAEPDSPVYRLAKLFALTLEADIIGTLAFPVTNQPSQGTTYEGLPVIERNAARVRNRDLVRWAVRHRPQRLLPAGHQDWPDYLESVARYTLLAARSQTPEQGEDTPWGEINRLALAHPLRGAIPDWLNAVRTRLALPDVPQAGDGGTVRTATPRFGASNRLIVAPGHEQRAMLQVPGGQSGHPLSAHFADRFEAWAAGDVDDPLLAGPARSTLRLVPEGP